MGSSGEPEKPGFGRQRSLATGFTGPILPIQIVAVLSRLTFSHSPPMSLDPANNDLLASASGVPTELPPDESAQPWGHFIPLRRAELVKLLAEDKGLTAEERQQFLELCTLVGSTIHFQYHQKLEELKESYFTLDPDTDERTRQPRDPAQEEAQAAVVFDKFGELMERANFRKLSREEVYSSLDSASHWGLHMKLDFQIFERLDVYARGDVLGQRQARNWRKWYREETVDVPTYQRLAIVFRLAEASGGRQPPDTKPRKPNENHQGPDAPRSPGEHRPIAMKLFKNIPKADLEMLLPGTKVKMSLLDQGKILIPTISGVGLALFKLFTKAAATALAGFSGMLGFLFLLGGTIGYGVKAFLGYLNTKDKYQLSLTRSLYFQNLDNNSGVFFRLLDEAEEQEFREAVLAWWLLWRQTASGDDGGWTARQIDRAAEKLLRERCDLKVDFEIDDALDKLRRLNLIEALPGEKWRAVSATSALYELDRAWDNFFTYHQVNETANKKNLLRVLQAA